MLGLFTKTYFIKSHNEKEDGTTVLRSWNATTASIFKNPVRLLTEYIEEKQKELGGVCMVTEFRRIE